MIKVIFTLFNLQGTALRQSLTRWLIYLSTFTSICQELFSRFFEEFSRFTFKPNSSIFSVFLSKLHQFLSLFVCRSLERLDILPHQFPFVNTFFQFFQESFQEGNQVRFWSKTVQKPWFLVPNQWVWCYPFLSMYAGVFGTWTTVFTRPHGGRRAILESPLRCGV